MYWRKNVGVLQGQVLQLFPGLEDGTQVSLPPGINAANLFLS